MWYIPFCISLFVYSLVQKNDGVIDFDEVKIVMKSVGLYPSNVYLLCPFILSILSSIQQKIRDIIQAVDLDKDGVINFQEVCI